jgi:hypothetical protein
LSHTPPVGHPSLEGNFLILGPAQRFCPRGEVSAPADEGGIPVVSFLLNGWHNTFTPPRRIAPLPRWGRILFSTQHQVLLRRRSTSEGREVVFVTHPARWAPLSRGELFNSHPSPQTCPPKPLAKGDSAPVGKCLRQQTKGVLTSLLNGKSFFTSFFQILVWWFCPNLFYAFFCEPKPNL